MANNTTNLMAQIFQVDKDTNFSITITIISQKVPLR